jgi:hypothetical protein
MSNSDDASLNELRQALKKTFFLSLGVQSKGLPDDGGVLQELEELRHELSYILSQIERSDEKDLDQHKSNLDARFRAIRIDAINAQHDATYAITTATTFVKETKKYETERRMKSIQTYDDAARAPELRKMGITKEIIKRWKQRRRHAAAPSDPGRARPRSSAWYGRMV